MKIALIAQEYYPEKARGGIGTQTFAKAMGLGSLGHAVYIITRSPDNRRLEMTEGNICTICIPGMESSIPEMTEIVQWITYSNLVAAELESLHRRVGLDIVDFPEWGAEGYTFLLNRTSWKKIPTVIQLHGPLVMLSHTIHWPETETLFYKIGTHMESMCVKLADAVYSSSQCTAEWVRSYYDPSKSKIPVIHLGVDTSCFYPRHHLHKKSPTIVFIGKVVQNKGIEELIEAVIKLLAAFPGLQVKIAGRGEESYIAKLKNTAAAHGIEEIVEFTGFVAKDQLPDLLSGADVFVAPSYYEGGPGFVYLEAMACGLPVIGCSGSGIDEIIQHEKTGILVPPRDADALTVALRRILSDNTFSSSLGTQARNYILEECDSRSCLKKLESFYYDVVESMQNENMTGK